MQKKVTKIHEKKKHHQQQQCLKKVFCKIQKTSR